MNAFGLSKQKANYAINPTPEQDLRSNRAVLPARVIAALDFICRPMVLSDYGCENEIMNHVERERESGNLFLSKAVKAWLSAFNLTLCCSVLVALMLGTPSVEVLMPVVCLLGAADPITESLSALKRHEWEIATANGIMAVGWILASFVIADIAWTS